MDPRGIPELSGRDEFRGELVGGVRPGDQLAVEGRECAGFHVADGEGEAGDFTTAGMLGFSCEMFVAGAIERHWHQ